MFIFDVSSVISFKDYQTFLQNYVKDRKETKMKTKAVISVTGKDNVGIIAKISNMCADYGANIIDISQTVLKEYFAMIMLVEIDSLTVPFTEFGDKVSLLGKEIGLEINAMHEDIFDSMHKI